MTRLCCTAALLLVSLLPARAGVVFFQFSGNVTQVPVDDLFGDIGFGDAIQGTFSFDSSANDLIPADPATGSYAFNSPFGVTVNIGTHTFTTSGSLSIGVLNAFVDQFTVLGTDTAGNLSLELFLQDSTGGAFNNDHLPLTLPSLTNFVLRDFHLTQSSAAGDLQIDGHLNAITGQAVPEAPSRGPLLAGSIAVIILRHRKRLLQFS